MKKYLLTILASLIFTAAAMACPSAEFKIEDELGNFIATARGSNVTSAGWSTKAHNLKDEDFDITLFSSVTSPYLLKLMKAKEDKIFSVPGLARRAIRWEVLKGKKVINIYQVRTGMRGSSRDAQASVTFDPTTRINMVGCR